MMELLHRQWTQPHALRPNMWNCNAALAACSRHAALDLAEEIQVLTINLTINQVALFC